MRNVMDSSLGHAKILVAKFVRNPTIKRTNQATHVGEIITSLAKMSALKHHFNFCPNT